MTLTDRQTQVMALIATGASYDAIGRSLGVTRQTIKNTAAEARKRAGVDNNNELFTLLGWLRVDPALAWPRPTVTSKGLTLRSQ